MVTRWNKDLHICFYHQIGSRSQEMGNQCLFYNLVPLPLVQELVMVKVKESKINEYFFSNISKGI